MSIVKKLNIENFKSIESLQMNCKRLNIFIGEPNVGKSNILEALSLLGGTYSKSEKMLSDFIRYEQFSNLFFDDDLQRIIKVNADDFSALLRHHNNGIDATDYFVGKKGIEKLLRYHNLQEIKDGFRHFVNDSPTNNSFSPFNLLIKKESNEKNIDVSDFPFSKNINSFFRKYDYLKQDFSRSKFHNYLLPPHGDNLFHILMNNPDLKKEITTIFKQRGLEVVFSKSDNSIELQKKDADNYVYKYPFSSTADTFQRLLFYFAVIESNKNSVLILEEPEVHSFPPYTTQLAERILQDTDNQYFITTHSQYFLGKLVEKADFEALNISIVYFENHQTKIKILSEEDLQEVVDYGTDLFFNLNKFISK